MNLLIEIWLCLLLATLIGWLVGWLLGRSRYGRPAENLDAELAGRMRLCEDERSRLQVQNADLKTRINTLEAISREYTVLKNRLAEDDTSFNAMNAGLRERSELREQVELLQRRVRELEWLRPNINNIEFPVDSAEITDSAGEMLEEVVPILKEVNDAVVEIGGHTDNIDSEEHNRDLSRQRAEAVRRYLIERGVQPNALAAVGYGAARPVADNATEQGRQHNRRIEFVIRQDVGFILEPKEHT